MQPPDESKQGDKFSRSRVMTSPGQQSISTKRLTQIASLDGVSAVTGSLSMSVMNVQGEFAQVQGGASGAQPSASAQQSGDGSSSQQGQAQMSPIDVSSLTVSGVDTSDLDLGPLSAAQIASGRALTSADANARVMLVTKAYATQNSLKVGDTKKIDGKKFTVVGIVALPAGSTSSDVYIPLSWAQKLSDNAGKVNQIYVKADSADDIATVQASRSRRSCPRRP